MSANSQAIPNLGRREATTLAAATTQRVFATVSDPAPAQRELVTIQNCDSSADLYVTLAKSGDSAPTISSADHDFIISPKSNRSFSIGTHIELWVRQSGGTTISYTARELL